MPSQERVKRAIRFASPDRMPVMHAILPAVQVKYGTSLNQVLKPLPDDFGWRPSAELSEKKLPDRFQKGKHYDEFGVLWQVENAGSYGIPVEFPLSDWGAYPSYQWPEPVIGYYQIHQYAGEICNGLKTYALGGWLSFFERMQQLRGAENLMMDLAFKTQEVYRLREDLLAYNLRWLDKLLAAQYDGLQFIDDWGAQKSLMIEPQLWRDFFKPVYKTMFEKVKNRGVDVHFHSDGYIMEIIPDLLDLGVDVLHCQCTIMDAEKLGRDFSGKVCFRTELDSQHILPFGTPRAVEKHVRHLFKHLGTSQGGLIACAEIGPDVPLENIRAIYQAFMAYAD
ncbi:hypothetical protein Calab_3431 [Caldithrix abyssi DSM 13497]|uniref:Uroporphyrinogen decarboxylase (URO-D) n=2 Tax=Caldithrix abyssi TaxID=187145 RepID=H1XWQ5_CALAY|nr:uroporphyrinogen decarboxylase family protein [Caldithrix abyssi]APF19096.1 Uroporphyrinogen decarboxylase (URO-D) [Caldithrix abyssi DSM 13497]EHO43031.1 hypothetical protein Calab_3431 [Caldithrix abyssi DSM 13497]